jgi:polyvinyl alcohol dehydrogenase (cytochrome)
MKHGTTHVGRLLIRANFQLWTIVGTLALLCTIFNPTTATTFAAATNNLTYAKANSQLAPATTGDWTTYMGSNAREGFNSAETVITTKTAPNLKLKWTHNAGGGIFSQPIVANGIIYWGSEDGYEHATTLSGGYVWATNLGTTPGDCSKSHTGVISTATVASEVIGGKTTSVVYVGGGDGHMYALNATTGAVIWRTALGNAPPHFLWSSPAVYNGSVYEGVASLDDCPLVQGQLVQMNAVTGAIQHTFNAVPNGCIGAGIWASPTIDESAGLVFVVTGNAGTCGSHEPYAVAMVKLNASNLSYVSSWQVPSSQQVSDSDFGATPTLFTATINGVLHNMVGAENKNGYFYAFDRVVIHTGPLWSVKVGCASCGGSQTPAAWDGTTLYVGSHGATVNGKSCAGSLNAVNPATGAFIWRHCMSGGAIYGAVMVVPGVAVIGEGQYIIAVDTSTGQTIFRYQNTKALFTGAGTISNGVLYYPSHPSASSGTLYAFAP